jgi:hypothetical protein
LLAKRSVSLADVFGVSYDPVAAKLLGDVIGLIVNGGSLDSRFRARLRNLVSGAVASEAMAAVDAETPHVGAANENGAAHYGHSQSDELDRVPDGDCAAPNKNVTVDRAGTPLPLLESAAPNPEDVRGAGE